MAAAHNSPLRTASVHGAAALVHRLIPACLAAQHTTPPSTQWGPSNIFACFSCAGASGADGAAGPGGPLHGAGQCAQDRAAPRGIMWATGSPQQLVSLQQSLFTSCAGSLFASQSPADPSPPISTAAAHLGAGCGARHARRAGRHHCQPAQDDGQPQPPHRAHLALHCEPGGRALEAAMQ